MPEIDTELFQQIVLGLLAVLVLIALLILSTLGKIHKALGKGVPVASDEGPAAEEEPHAASEPQPAASVTTDVYADSWSAPATTQPQPVVAQEPEPETQTMTATATAVPEEQPFERDGRWWFKRGNEMLVYDEQTGQWKPAPAQDFAPTSAAGTTGEPADTAQGGFWKCPSCGAVNGSTSATCRMCFTPRPA